MNQSISESAENRTDCLRRIYRDDTSGKISRIGARKFINMILVLYWPGAPFAMLVSFTGSAALTSRISDDPYRLYRNPELPLLLVPEIMQPTL